MMDFTKIILLWPNNSELAYDLTIEMNMTISAYRVSSWKTRNNIPPPYWRPLVKVAEKRGFSVDIELFLDIVSDYKVTF